MKRYKAVIFDVDGTLLDTSEGILTAVREAVEHMGREPLADDEWKKFIGPPVEWSFEELIGLKGDDNKEACRYFRDRYSNHHLFLAKPYEGIFDLLEYLKKNGYKIAVATYKKQDYTDKLMHHFGIDKYADVIYGSDYENKLLKSDIIKLCLDEVSPDDYSEALMVGDTKHDARGAEVIGASFAGVSFGFGFGPIGGEDINEYKHDVYVDSPAELIEYLEDN